MSDTVSPYVAAAAARAAEIRPAFKIGQIWSTREIRGHLWTIEAITAHPRSPVIARNRFDSIRAYGLDGAIDGDDSSSDGDLAHLVGCAP